ncbi:MAG: DUF3224 domain-containing protein [Chloroflexi bacterium]|nr:DUF3224 domain-containing protein [Chloroflexota bacterium]
MTSQPNVSFALKAWDEKPYNELPGELKMTRSSVAYTYQGDIEGESTLDYLMVYRPDESGSFVGLERIIGRVAGRAGSFVIQHTGTFNKTDVAGTFFVVPQSGTGELATLRGEGEIVLSGHAESYPMKFCYTFE